MNISKEAMVADVGTELHIKFSFTVSQNSYNPEFLITY